LIAFNNWCAIFASVVMARPRRLPASEHRRGRRQRNPVLRRKAERALDGWIDRLRKLLSKVNAPKEIRAEVNADEVAATIISTSKAVS